MKTPLLSASIASGTSSRRWLLAAAAGLLTLGSAQAQAPTNDECTGAIALPVSTTCTPLVTTNVNATGSTGVPAPTCGSAAAPSNDVWYSVVVPSSGAVTVTTSAVTGSTLTDTVLELYSGTCGSLTSVGCNDDATGLFSQVALTGRTPGATLYARVRSYGTTPTGQFGICATTLAANDLATQVIYTLGTVSNLYSSPVTVQAVIRNAGGAASTARVATLTVSGAVTATLTQPVPALAVGASTVVTFSYPLGTVSSGTATLTVSVPADDLSTNNTQTVAQTISTNALNYTVGTTYTSGVGVAAAGAVIATRFQTTGPASLTSVNTAFSGAGTSGTTYQVLVYSVTPEGLPGTVLYTSPVRSRPTATGVDAVPVTGVNVNGAFFVAQRVVQAVNLGIAYQTEAPLRGGTFFYSLNGTTGWVDINTETINSRLAVGVTLNTVLSTRNEALAAKLELYPNPAHQSFKLNVPAGTSLRSAKATLTNTLGQVVQERQLAVPASGGTIDFDVSRLSAGIYNLQLKAGSDVVVKRVVVE